MGSYAFANNNSLTTATINCDEIGAYAFGNCVNLANVVLENVQAINEGAFINCIKLESIESNSLAYVGAYAFADCIKLAYLDIVNVVEIGAYAFATTTDKTANVLKTITFGNKLESIGAYAFYGSLELKTVTIGNSLNEIGAYAFATCRSLETIDSVFTVSFPPIFL